MIKFIYSILFAIILFFAVRSSLIPYIASNENIVAILVIFILIIINSWILGLISNVRNKKKVELEK
ncbi:hypothetical protein [Bacillus sp. 105MF]|uniref:hypothetical protein n=1 Tax=Bacillus sp. 105MF TaxID=1151120 RepID=UPI000371C41B